VAKAGVYVTGALTWPIYSIKGCSFW